MPQAKKTPRRRAAAPRRRAPARPSQEQRRQATRQKLLEAMLHSLARNGYAATSVRLVTAQARVSRGAWSHHFASMDELILAAAKHLMTKVYERLAALMLAWGNGGNRMHDMVRAAWTEFFASEVNDVYLELLVASRRDRRLAALLGSVARNIDKGVEGISQRFFEPTPGAVNSTSEMLLLNRWLLRGMALDGHILPQPVIDTYLAAWSRLAATQMRTRFGKAAR
ncbi:MAG TPA: TetR/AcrR family transcriptional regulator [Candidatus Binatia bacterium]|nr:TetR/AcrR family transcriptional regulator [Candidatus Binatia bacterium]